MKFVVSIVTVCPMRKEPSHRSEMVSQLLFGEFAELLEDEKEFIRVKCLYDGYEGWCQKSQLQPTDTAMETGRYLLAETDSILMGEDISIPVVFGSPVYGGEDDDIKFGDLEIGYTIPDENTWTVSKEELNEEQIRFVAEKYAGTSYLWGGKSLFGIDCSGFVQQVYKFFEVALLRDAYLQAEQGESIEFSEIQVGDLAFFKNENEKVTHVGLMLEDNQIIHASGMVRVDELKEDGIYRLDTGERTHVLHSVRRVAIIHA